MASISAHLLLLLHATVLLAACASARPLSDDICKTTRHPTLCKSLAASSGNFNSQKDLTLAAIKQAVSELKSGSEAAEKLRVAAAADKDELREGYLNGCKNDYNTAAEDLGAGLDYIEASGPDWQIKNYLGSALSDIGTCSDEWNESKIFKDFPLEHVDGRLKKLVENVYDLGADLGGKD